MTDFSTKHVVALVAVLAGGCSLFQGSGDSNSTPDDESAESAPADEADTTAEVEPAVPNADSQPNPELRQGLQCAGLNPVSVTIGRIGSYDVRQGLATETRDGFLDRRDASLSDPCFLENLEPGECAVFRFPKEAYEGLVDDANDWKMQCVSSDDVSAGTIPMSFHDYSDDRVSARYKMLLCGHSLGEEYECMDGSSGVRGGAYRDRLEEQGFVEHSFCAHHSAEDPGDELVNAYVFCQFTQLSTGKVLFATEYRRTARPD